MAKKDYSGSITASGMTPEQHEWLEGLRNQAGESNYAPWLIGLVKENEKLKEENGKLKAKRSSSLPTSSDKIFIAKIHPRHAKMVEAMREYLDEEHGLLNDDNILLWFARLTRSVKTQVVHIVKPNKTTNQHLIEKGQKAVDDGEYQNMNHFLSKMMQHGLSIFSQKAKAPKKEEKSGGFWF